MRVLGRKCSHLRDGRQDEVGDNQRVPDMLVQDLLALLVVESPSALDEAQPVHPPDHDDEEHGHDRGDENVDKERREPGDVDAAEAEGAWRC